MVITGRTKEQLDAFLPLPGLFAATSQGFEITGPGYQFSAVGAEQLKGLEAAYARLTEFAGSAEMSGVQLEHKKYTLAIHYRHAAPEAEAALLQFLQTIVHQSPDLKLHYGKKVTAK